MFLDMLIMILKILSLLKIIKMMNLKNFCLRNQICYFYLLQIWEIDQGFVHHVYY